MVWSPFCLLKLPYIIQFSLFFDTQLCSYYGFDSKKDWNHYVSVRIGVWCAMLIVKLLIFFFSHVLRISKIFSNIFAPSILKPKLVRLLFGFYGWTETREFWIIATQALSIFGKISVTSPNSGHLKAIFSLIKCILLFPST